MNLTSFLQDKRLMIALKGDIDHHGAKDVMRVLGNKIDLYLPAVCVLDFRDVTFMDSSGIAIIISCIRRMRELGGEVIGEDLTNEERWQNSVTYQFTLPSITT